MVKVKVIDCTNNCDCHTWRKHIEQEMDNQDDNWCDIVDCTIPQSRLNRKFNGKCCEYRCVD